MAGIFRAACALALCSALGCSPRVDFERMRQQQRADPYSASTTFSNGVTMRVPPPGTIPIDQRNASEEVVSGQREFEVFCAVCHGRDGSGGSVMSTNIPGPRPPSLLTGDPVVRSDAELLDIISHGRNRMPAYDWALPGDGRQRVLTYMRRLQQSARGAAPEAAR